MKSTRESLRVRILLLGGCLLWSSAACGQSAKRLEGRILDQLGAKIPGAAVTLYSDDRVRTSTTDGDGNFVFAGLTSPARYLEASSKGFRSSSMFITDGPSGPISIILSVRGCAGNCDFQYDLRDHSVHYEERDGSEQLTGSLSEFGGPLLPNTSLTLMKADVDTTLPSHRNPTMNERSFIYTFVVQVVSNERGEFQFTGLEPGWYSLEAVHVGYEHEMTKFWIARETLTRLSRIEMLRTGPAQPSPFLPALEFPIHSN